MVLSAADAEDLCQETFLKVVRAKKKYRATAKFKTWLFHIALNLCRDRIRRMKFRSHLSLNSLAFSQDSEEIQLRQPACDPSCDPAKSAQADEMNTLVRQAFTKLPEQQRTAGIFLKRQLKPTGSRHTAMKHKKSWPTG